MFRVAEQLISLGKRDHDCNRGRHLHHQDLRLISVNKECASVAAKTLNDLVSRQPKTFHQVAFERGFLSTLGFILLMQSGIPRRFERNPAVTLL
jgi:hypothetical protein